MNANDKHSRKKQEPDFVEIVAHIDTIRDRLSKACRHAEMAFIFISDRDMELTMAMLRRFVEEAKEVSDIILHIMEER